MNISAFRRFVNRQGLYFWMLVFVVLTSSVNLLTQNFVPQQARAPEESEAMASSKLSLTQGELEAKVKQILETNSGLSILLLGIGFFIFLIFIAGTIIGIILIYQKAQGRPLVPFSLPQSAVSWQIWDVLKVVIMLGFFAYIISNIEFFIFGKQKSIALMVGNAFLSEILIAGLLIYVAVGQTQRGLQDLGLRIDYLFKNILAGVVGYIVFFPLLVVVTLTVAFLTGLFKFQPLPHPMLETLVEGKNPLILSLIIFLAVFVAPLVEELFFRGFMYKVLRNRIGIGRGILLTSAIFAFLHANIIAFLPIFGLALMLNYLYEKTGSLVSSITLHSLHNTAVVIILLLGKALLASAV
jgi:hypothetical protein